MPLSPDYCSFIASFIPYFLFYNNFPDRYRHFLYIFVSVLQIPGIYRKLYRRLQAAVSAVGQEPHERRGSFPDYSNMPDKTAGNH